MVFYLFLHLLNPLGLANAKINYTNKNTLPFSDDSVSQKNKYEQKD